MIFVSDRVENFVGNGENADNQHCLLFSKGFFLEVVKSRDCVVELIWYFCVLNSQWLSVFWHCTIIDQKLLNSSTKFWNLCIWVLKDLNTNTEFCIFFVYVLTNYICTWWSASSQSLLGSSSFSYTFHALQKPLNMIALVNLPNSSLLDENIIQVLLKFSRKNYVSSFNP